MFSIRKNGELGETGIINSNQIKLYIHKQEAGGPMRRVDPQGDMAAMEVTNLHCNLD